jgi:hypothetical protein
MRALDTGVETSSKDDRDRTRRLRARYRERAGKLRARALAMVSADTRQVMLGIADYFQRMADRLEAASPTAKALKRSAKTE